MMKITPFSPAERKALMEELFPLKRTARDYDLRQDMTPGRLHRRVVFRAQRQLDSGTLPSDSVRFRRLADLVTKQILPGGGGAVPRLEGCREGTKRGGMTDADLRTGREALQKRTACRRARPPCSVAGYQTLPAHHAKKDRLSP